MNINIKTLLVLLFHSTFAFQSCNIQRSREAKASINPPIDIPSQTSDKDINNVVIDTFQTSLANFISGKDKSYFDTIVEINNEFWSKFREKIDDDYIKLEMRRLNKIKTWSNNSFISSDIDTSLVFYPFSGPDFLHVNFLYPDANEYVLLALEKVGNIPNWKDIGKKASITYLENTNDFLRDIYLRSYFITIHMQLDIEKENKIPGVLPSLYWFLSRTDHQIVKMERVTIDENGNLDFRESNKGIDGVRFHFIKKGETNIKKLTYFCCNISDNGFTKENPEVLIYLNNMRSCNTFIKAASYLMHYKSFEDIRDVILDKSQSIFQDDTGIPYKYVDNDDWDIRCFGSYLKPIKDFEGSYNIIYQNDLEKRYKGDTEKLPFSLGYHWRDASEQNQMLMIKQKE